jgi:orotate phosphoribosyltransferase
LLSPSGAVSPVGVDTLAISTRPAEMAAVLDALASQVTANHELPDVVASADTGAIFLGTRLAEQLDRPMVYLRPKAKEHGRQKRIEGELAGGARALVVFESLFDARPLNDVVAALEEAGAGVSGVCVALWNDDAADLKEAMRELPLSGLTSLSSLVKVAFERGLLPTETLAAVEEWARSAEVADPEQFAARALEDQRRGLVSVARADSARRVAQALLAIGAVTINRAQPFRYASGILSPIYTDNRLLISHPAEWDVILDGFVEVIDGALGRHEFDRLSGAATAGIPHAARLSGRLGLPLVYVLSDGGRDRLVGPGRYGDRVLIIEDHITTGKSALESARALRAIGARLDWCLSISTLDVVASSAALAREGLNYAPLCDLPTLLEVAQEQRYIGGEDREAVLEWVRDPNAWSERAGREARAES